MPVSTEHLMREFQFVRPENLESSFGSLGKSIAVTKGHFEIEAPCEVRDLNWNHMDQHHRPVVHSTYEQSVRLITQPHFALSLTNFKFFNLPFFVAITDMCVESGVFYQVFSVFSIMFVHIVIKSLPGPHPEKDRSLRTIDWYIVSRPLFRFLHRFIDRRLTRLNEIQNAEDLPLQQRRTDLRKKGYRFASDAPDFVISTALTNNTYYPPLGAPCRISLTALPAEGIHNVTAGPVDLLVRRESDGGCTVWFAACPHEGGPLGSGQVCGNEIRCPWHALRFPGTHLTPHQPQGTLGTLFVSLDDEHLSVKQK